MSLHAGPTEADVKAASGVDTNIMLGLVGGAVAEGALPDTASMLDGIMNAGGASADDAGGDDTPPPEETEPPVFKTPRPDADINDYRLADPSVYRGEQSRVDLSNYRQKDPSQAQVQQAPATLSPAAQSALLQDIWNETQEQHDLSEAPQLVAAMEKLTADMQAQADAEPSERRLA